MTCCTRWSRRLPGDGGLNQNCSDSVDRSDGIVHSVATTRICSCHEAHAKSCPRKLCCLTAFGRNYIGAGTGLEGVVGSGTQFYRKAWSITHRSLLTQMFLQNRVVPCFANTY